MQALRWIGFALGILIVIGTWASVVTTLIVPRGLTSRASAAVERVTRGVFLALANRFESYEAKDRILVLEGPALVLALLLTWIGSFLLGYSLIMYPLVAGSFASALRESGSSMFTLGFASTPGAAPTVVQFASAFTGLIAVALQIAYLPALYSSFNRRETLVTMLQSRAGSPAWGPEILLRHHTVNMLNSLRPLYLDWEQWAADVAESHTNYPILISFRSPHALRSWLLGLLAVMDSAALYNSLCPSASPSEARLCLRMGFTCLRDLAKAVRIPYDPDPFPDDPIELTFEEFKGAVDNLQASGFPIERSTEEAWEHFRGWRVNYEAIAYALADHIVAPPGPWSGERRHLPGMAIVPQRPANRRPEDRAELARPRGQGTGW